jgi:ABC-2 type transport system permease protein
MPPSTRLTPPLGPMLREQVRAELLRYLRSPVFSVFTLALPVVFYLFFGISNSRHTIAGVPGGAYLLASFATYGVANVMLSTFGMGVALDRGRRMDALMRATPLRPAVFMASRVVVAVVFGLLALAAVSVFAVVTGGVRMEARTWAAFVGWLLVGSLPFLALGLAIGYLVSANSAPAVVNLVALPLYFASGIFTPVSQLPHFIGQVAPYLPTYRLGQLAWGAIGATGTDPLGANLLWLGGYTLVFLLVAVRAYAAEESRRFA